ncbi:hypothetical protein PR048_015984 [Dryococelus australis]|uniref:Uncharacterized protein n=1 Tax=Dryococelus australis TaxID=614101 RepID=A0ABQ9HIH0_9NEOP|nr:hypothetical protein PR048_015984 [Dryococelus australis]
MVYMTGHLNDLNLKLQGAYQLIISMYDHSKAFNLKLNLWEGQLNSGNLIHFPACLNFRKSHSGSNFSQYTFNVNELINEFESRFEDFKMPENNFSLFNSNVQMELIEVQCDTCSEMLQFAVGILAMVGSTYLCEQLFSLMKANKTYHRSRLSR